MGTQTFLTLGQAAKECGRSKGTLSKALKGGRLSYVEKVGNQYRIDPAELFRVFPAKPFRNVDSERHETPKNGTETKALEKEIELLREQLKDKNATIEDLRDDRDQWRRQATNLLTQQQPQQMSFFGRLFGRRSG